MYDSYNRKINYLRISVTDRCNLRCRYCMPEDGVVPMRHSDILTFDEIVEVVRVAKEMGFNKFRITGGEPLVRKNIVELVSMIAKVVDNSDLAMTTNAVLLSQFAQPLKDVGLQRINISLDTVNPDKFKFITRLGSLEDVFQGIETAQRIGFQPIKINCVIKQSSEETDAQEVAAFCKANGLQIRYIREMDLEKGTFWKVKGGDGGDCAICNRLRLTSNGKIKPCLFNDKEFDVRTLGAKQALETAISRKPTCGTHNAVNQFNNIGG